MTAVVLSVDADSQALYLEALRISPSLSRHFVIEVREPTPEQAKRYGITEEGRQMNALKRGQNTLKAIRKHLRDSGQDDPQRAIWRDAQRRHRAVGRG